MSSDKTLLEIENLHFRWPKGQREVLSIPECELTRGERVFLKGQSGSGKTTLLSLIGGINLPSQGSIRVLGQDLAKLSQSKRDKFRADHIGFIFQLFNLIPYLSLIENITLACKFSPDRTKRALKKSPSLEAEAIRLLAHLQLGDSEIIKKPVADLSVGQQQRVAVARALIGAPELIIADEPTSALDANTRKSFINLLLSECELSGSTVLFVSHDSALETAFDRSIDLREINVAGSDDRELLNESQS